MIELGRQGRPHLYELCVSAPPPLVPAELRFGAPGAHARRPAARPLDPALARALVEEIARARPEAVAVALLHSYAHPSHERLLGTLIAEHLPEVHVSLSFELVGTFREYERTATTVLDAALSPLLGAYLRRLSADARSQGLPEPQVMQSSGGLTDSEHAAAHAALTVLSGPAGGVGGALLLAELADEPNVLCFDMGGTSCDVCLIEGFQVAETAERTVAGRPLSLPALDIHTVGAGGGSIAWRDPGGALRVGPASAGAVPGTRLLRPRRRAADRHRRQPPARPPARGLAPRRRPLARPLRRRPRAVSRLAAELDMDVLACAQGIVRVAEAEMLGALRLMTVERGSTHAASSLMPFGGAGPLHAAALARELGIERILCPRASGVLCALGLAAAAPRRDVSRTVMLRGDSLTLERLSRERDALISEADAALAGKRASVRVSYELRYRGQSFELSVEAPESPTPTRCARRSPARTSCATATATTRPRSSWSTSACRSGGLPPPAPAGRRRPRRARCQPPRSCSAARHCRPPSTAASSRPGSSSPAPRYARWERPPCWSRPAGRRGPSTSREPRRYPDPAGLSMLDPIELQVVTGALRAACEEMGVVLIRSAHSSNIKERRDASTALFDPTARWSCRPSTSRCTSARCPPPSPRSSASATPRRLLDPQRPVRGWHPPARHHRHHARFAADASTARLRRQPRPPRRRRRARARGRCPPTAARSRRRAW